MRLGVVEVVRNALSSPEWSGLDEESQKEMAKLASDDSIGIGMTG